MTYFKFIPLIALVSGFAFAQESEVFTCGQWPTFYYLSQKDDGSFVAFTATQGFVPTPIERIPATVTATKISGKCRIEVNESKSSRNARDRAFEMPLGGRNTSLRYVSSTRNEMSDEERSCVIQNNYSKSLANCETPTKNADTRPREPEVIRKIDLYACNYLGLPLRVVADDYNLKVHDPSSGRNVCIARIECNWKGTPPWSTEGWIESYETWVACFPSRDGTCNKKSYETCRDEEGLSFVNRETGDSLIKRDLGIKSTKGAR